MPYTEMYKKAQIRPEKKAELSAVAAKIKAGQARYEVVSKITGVPWWFIGITHFMEAGGFKNPFAYHLHCGDPLTGRTTHVPKGRPTANPANGKPPSELNPYTWEESAVDALSYMGYTEVKDWGLENALQLFEKFNGLGYKKRGVPSPYLWSYTDQYVSGKYVLDGKYDPNKVSKQPGTAAIMKVLGI